MKINNRLIIRWIFFILIIIAIALALVNRDKFNTESIEQWVTNAGIAGPIVYMLIYIAATVLFLPGSVLTISGGLLFGPVLGTFYSLTAATIGASLAFLMARYLASDWVEQKAGGIVKRLKAGVESEGWRFVAFVRLVPLFPFNLLNYALGLTRIKLSHYIIASYLFMLPGTIAYTYLGFATREAVAGSADLSEKIKIATIALALLAFVAFLPRLISLFRGSAKNKD